MKITFLLPAEGTGGGGRAITNFANNLLSYGHEVRILYFKRKISIRKKIRNIYYNFVYGKQEWTRFFKSHVNSYTILNDKNFSKGEFVLSMCAKTTLDMDKLSDKNVLKVYHCHGAEIENWENMLEAWHRPIFKLSISKKLAEDIKNETGHKVFEIVPDGVNIKEYYSNNDYDNRDGVTSSFRPRYSKDPNNIIRIFNNLKKNLPEAELRCFGTVRPKGLTKNVEYSVLPSVENARKIYSKSRVFFLPSIEEGFGLPILEAMACGVPVVATKSGGPQDIISHGVNGYLTDIGNYGDIERYIKILYRDKKIWERMSKKAIETAKEYSWEKAAKDMETALKKIRKEVASFY